MGFVSDGPHSHVQPSDIGCYVLGVLHHSGSCVTLRVVVAGRLWATMGNDRSEMRQIAVSSRQTR